MNLVVLLSLLLIAAVATAQDGQPACPPDRYEIGVAVGRNQYFGDLHCSDPYPSSGFNMGLLGFVRRDINRFITLRGNLYIGQLAADDYDNPTGRWDYRLAQFTSPLVELSAQAEVYPFRKKGPNGQGVAVARVSPYGFVGIGGAYTNPIVPPPAGQAAPAPSLLADDARQKKLVAAVVPVGFGLAVAITRHVRINAEIGYRFTTSDYLDGFKAAAYTFSQYNDSYLIANLGVAYRLKGSDRDRDGVADQCDACPNLYGTAAQRGCPDTDGDGVIDPEDSCPDEFGDPATCGCPDDDHDGVPNACDCCPSEPGERANHGCPKEHQVEYEHTRMPARMRYCPLCPPDLPTARRSKRTNRLLTVRTR